MDTLSTQQDTPAYIDIHPPELSDLLTDYNTIRNIDIPPPVWANLDPEYAEMMGLPPPPTKLELEYYKMMGLPPPTVTQPPRKKRTLGIDSGSSSSTEPEDVPAPVILKADGTPLRRIPLIRAKPLFDLDDSDDEETAESKVIAIRQTLGSIKAAAAARRAKNPSPMAIATNQAAERVAVAKADKSNEEIKKIQAWDQAISTLNQQRDEIVLKKMQEMNLLGEKEKQKVIKSHEPFLELEEESRFVEIEETAGELKVEDAASGFIEVNIVGSSNISESLDIELKSAGSHLSVAKAPK